ncbi:hypothetical protein [Nitrososphaera viennensis]|uniref:Uncharacterized protein n=1 Tax=Nitrososphaera viennensis EN76 TaxID=926571 RepID=A0A060HP59_9ARCH|nr:hypothetical protein [Nitrososphaera viennensis]AIC15351.1 hypothetical protein NVIE_011210 [Nitrososphaera viennensis EN76]
MPLARRKYGRRFIWKLVQTFGQRLISLLRKFFHVKDVWPPDLYRWRGLRPKQRQKRGLPKITYFFFGFALDFFAFLAAIVLVE